MNIFTLIYLGASLASMAASSPMAVKTMTSGTQSATGLGSLVIAGLTGILLVDAEELLNLLTNLTIRDLDIILGAAIVGHEGQETIVSDIKLVLS